MNENPESIPLVWTTTDTAFFRVVQHLFDSCWVAGATVLLASYDDEAQELFEQRADEPAVVTAEFQPVLATSTVRLQGEESQ